MIKFTTHDSNLILEYDDDLWIHDKLKKDDYCAFHKTFTVYGRDLLDNSGDYDVDDEKVRFLIGTVDDKYQTIRKSVLGIKHDLLISRLIVLKKKMFVATGNISIFRHIDEMISEQIIIGGNRDGAIPEDVFFELLETFPTKTELDHYARARIQRKVGDYLGTISDAESKLADYMKKRAKQTNSKANASYNIFIHDVREFEKEKYICLRDEIKSMLSDEGDPYSELDWQKKIADFFLLIFPQYVAVLDNLTVGESCSKPGKTTKRKFDLALVDVNGGVDLIEIKKPFKDSLVSKKKYRDNHTPKRELSGAVMQAEKYLFYLSRSAEKAEKDIEEKYKDKLPSGLKIRITNPKAIILNGRDQGLTDKQRFDFSFIRRKYSNMIDILSYDDLLRRIDNTISMIEANK